MKCLQCGQEFTPVRKTKLFCSDKCRIYHNRQITKIKPDPEIAKPIKPKSTFKFGKPKEKKPELVPVHSKGYCKHGVSLDFGICKYDCKK